MKQPSEIRERLRFLLAEELDQRVKAATTRAPGRCRHNYQHPLDVRRRVTDQPNPRYNRVAGATESVGLCTLGMEDPTAWNGTICEDLVDAQRCPYFDGRLQREQIWQEFRDQIQDSEWLAANLPEVYGLMWVLSESVPIGWWRRVWFWIRPLRVERIRPLQLPELL